MAKKKSYNYELKKLADLWLDVSKISLGSLVIKLLEPDGPKITLGSVIVAIGGLTLSCVSAKLGLSVAREVTED
jgi:hypothetical protein